LFSNVIEENGKILGHIALSPMKAAADGQPIRALGLGPVAVMPDRQRSGIGSQLIHAATSWARTGNWRLIILLGDPDYYCRFGFSADAAKPFDSPYTGPYFQALWLDESPQTPQSGRADYASAFGRL
jgi:putative acetyltransferase